MKRYQYLAQKISAYWECQDKKNTYWEERHLDQIEQEEEECHLSNFEIEKEQGFDIHKLLKFSFDHVYMDENGYILGFQTIHGEILPNLVYGYEVVLYDYEWGDDDDEFNSELLADYLYEVLYDYFNMEIETVKRNAA